MINVTGGRKGKTNPNYLDPFLEFVYFEMKLNLFYKICLIGLFVIVLVQVKMLIKLHKYNKFII